MEHGGLLRFGYAELLIGICCGFPIICPLSGPVPVGGKITADAAPDIDDVPGRGVDGKTEPWQRKCLAGSFLEEHHFIVYALRVVLICR